MPLFDYLCEDCGKITEFFITASSKVSECSQCGSKKVKKLMPAHSSVSGTSKNRMPGNGDTACCGSSPVGAVGCAGPGSCCGKKL